MVEVKREAVCRAEYSPDQEDIPDLVTPNTFLTGYAAGFEVWDSKKK